ncbi:MAG: glycosyltransferase family 1 protein [Nitrospirales bacterium]
MKIVIAAWHLRNLNVGLGRYTHSLIEGLGRMDRENHYEILIPGDSHSFKSWPNIRYRFFPFPVFKRRFWEQIAPLLIGRYDLIHFPYDSCLAIKRGKFVVTLHDVKPLLFPKPSKIFDWKRLLKKMVLPHPLRQIDHIVTVSECSRRDIMERLEVSGDRITVIYQGVDLERFSPHVRFQVEEGSVTPYVLCVAGADPTKNVKNLIIAFSLLPAEIRERHHLVLVGDVGRQGEIRQMVKQREIEKQTVYTGVVSDERLASLYQQASVFVFLSLYEGFGLPVLEAMACGCPVISSNTSSLPEVVGDAGILVDPLDISAIVRTMERVLNDTHLVKNLRMAGIARAQKFSWDTTAKATVNLYDRVVNS